MIGPNNDVYTVLVDNDERGQTVRLPEGVRISADRVRVRRDGERVVLEPVAQDEPRDWPAGFWETFHRLPAPTFERPEQLPGSTTYRDHVIEEWVAEMNDRDPAGEGGAS